MAIHEGQVLHDRATRGEELTVAEQQALEAWYGEQDQAEATMLQRHSSDVDTVVLRAQLEAAIKQLALVSQHISDVMATNDELRRDIAQLQRQLAPQSYGQAA